MVKYDEKVFETACPESCPQSKNNGRQNCLDCPMHGKCPLQEKSAISVDVNYYKNAHA